MIRYWYLLKLLKAWRALAKVSNNPLRVLWKALWQAPMLPLRLSPQDPERRFAISLPNLYALIQLQKAGWTPQVVDEATLSWELVPSRLFHTRLSPGMDLIALHEVFIRQDYGHDFTNQAVLDVGAYNGDSAVFFALHGAKKVVALEPYPPSLTLARANVERMGLSDRITLLEAALGPETGRATFQVASRDPEANALQPTPLAQRLTPYDQRIEVPVYSLEKLLTDYGPFDFMKLDCEGCEFALVARTPDAVLQAIPTWHIEYHANPTPLEKRFRALGFYTHRALDRWGLGYLWVRRR